jgi:amidophosphoribosyltransferase
MCGVLGIFSKKEMNLVNSLPLLQLLAHRGQDASGIAWIPKFRRSQGLQEIQTTKVKGLPLDMDVPDNSTHLIVGSTRYPTYGKKSNESNLEDFAQPFTRYTPWGPLSVVHNGNIIFAPDTGLRNVDYCSDAEIITELLTQYLMKGQGDLLWAVTKLMKNIDGAYSICGIFRNKMFAFRDPYAIRPLCFSHTEDIVVVSSESIVFNQMGLEKTRDVSPGELIIFEDDDEL